MLRRQEHLEWCKKRAIEYIENNDLAQAFTSFQSDMTKHPETANHPALQFGALLFFTQNLSKPFQMKEWIDGFN